MTPRSVKRADVLDRRRTSRRYRKRAAEKIAKKRTAEAETRRRLDQLAQHMAALDRARDKARETAAQRLRCLIDGCDGTAECHKVQTWFGCEKEPPHLILSQCDWEDCPTPDCVNHGPCQCVCHPKETP